MSDTPERTFTLSWGDNEYVICEVKSLRAVRSGNRTYDIIVASDGTSQFELIVDRADGWWLLEFV